MKKVIIGLIVAIVIIVAGIGFMFWKSSKSDDTTTETASEEETATYYGKRGNITETQRIKFLSQNDEYLVGMMGLSASTELKNFTNDDMIRFALNIAVERYSTMLDQKSNWDGTYNYVIQTDTVDAITEEFFGIDSVSFDQYSNEYYSVSSKAFLFNENLEKTLYYYPVSQETKEDGTIEITADAIFINDGQTDEEFEAAKYEGKYEESNIDSTIKFVFSAEGALVSYQYL